MRIWHRWTLVVVAAAALALGACSGEDGASSGGGTDGTGAQGQGGEGQGGSGQGGGGGQGGGAADECAPIPSCSICAECTAAGSCMAEWAACEENPECTDLFTCHRDCLPSDTACPGTCDQTYAGGLAEFGAFRTCYEDICVMGCGG